MQEHRTPPVPELPDSDMRHVPPTTGPGRSEPLPGIRAFDTTARQNHPHSSRSGPPKATDSQRGRLSAAICQGRRRVSGDDLHLFHENVADGALLPVTEPVIDEGELTRHVRKELEDHSAAGRNVEGLDAT